MVEQVLDQLELERERGITIKAQAVRMLYKADDGQTYQINLIDTPGHVDFSYEVSRALAACDGAILVVDASQGIEAQTLANVHQALEHHLKIVPVVNKIDLPQANPELVREEIEKVIGLPAESVIFASARQGIGTKEILEAVVREVPPPTGDPTAPLRALIFDAKFDPYRGVVTYVRVLDGTLRKGLRAQMMQTGKSFEVDEVGIFRPERTPVEDLSAGEVGYLIANIRNVRDSRVGDTVTDAARPASAPLPGYLHVTPMVFAGLFPTDTDQYQQLKEALEKLQLNDAALVYEPETSAALGFGFRCGFLGLLHMEIVQERLEREFGLNLITTAPSVRYRITRVTGEVIEVDSPSKFPNPSDIEKIEEPLITAMIITNEDSIGGILQLCQEKRGAQKKFEYLSPTRVMLIYELPLNEIVLDTYDRLKSTSRRYASLESP